MPRVILQAGHCHRKTGSTGTRSAAGYTEQQFTWAVANRARDLLAGDGHQAVVILADPADGAYAGDAFVAIHADGNNDPRVRGASVGYRTDEGRALAHAWKTAYRGLGWDHGFRGDNYTAALGGYYGTKRAVAAGNRRACILEFGFLTNPAEAAELASPAGQERAAQAIRSAVNAVFGLPANPPPAHQEDTEVYPLIADLYEDWGRNVLKEDFETGLLWWLRHGHATGEVQLASDLAGALAHAAGF